MPIPENYLIIMPDLLSESRVICVEEEKLHSRKEKNHQ
jgi:hypothetical protein